MGARESRSSATAATSRSRSRVPFKVGSSTLSTLAVHRALEGELQALENGWTVGSGPRSGDYRIVRDPQ